MIVRCKSCQRHIGVTLGHGNALREELSGFAALAGTCDPARRGNGPCHASQRYEELRPSASRRLEEAECP